MAKFIRMAAVTYLAYILQTTAFRYIPIAGIEPDVLAAALAALVYYGGTYEGFCVGAVFGLLMDTAVGQVAGLYLVLYPLMGYVAARMYKGIAPRFIEAASQKHRTGRKLLLSIVICISITAIREVVFLVYTYLNGVDLTMRHVGRVLLCLAYSGVVVLPICKMTDSVMRMRAPRFRHRGKADPDA